MSKKLDEIEARIGRATPGPWYVVGASWRRRYDKESEMYETLPAFVLAASDDPNIGALVLNGFMIEEWDTENGGPDYSQQDADLEFAAHARADVPYLLRIARAAQAAVDAFSGCDLDMLSAKVYDNLVHLIASWRE